MYSYRFFSIHCLHPQSPVGLWESLQGDDAMSAETDRSFYPSTTQQIAMHYIHTLSVIFPSHLSTTSMSKQKRLSIESVFLLTHERRLNISGVTFTTPFCEHRDVELSTLNLWYCSKETLLLSTFRTILVFLHSLLFSLHKKLLFSKLH